MRRCLVVWLIAACSSSPDNHPADSGDNGPMHGDAEVPPEPASGDGVQDPPSTSLHDHNCGGVDWQLIARMVHLSHAAPPMAAADEVERCVQRYAGWATNEADAAQVSRAMMYAALAAMGQCAGDHEWDGAVMTGEQCASVTPGVSPEDCAMHMRSSRAFGIATLAKLLATAGSDVPLVAAKLATGSATCGGSDRWKLVAPDGFVDHFTGAYNAFVARTHPPAACGKRIVVTVALYTGMDKPGEAGVADSNGCWTYERVTKDNAEWKLCQYSGTVFHPDGAKWVYDDTNTFNNLATETARINACRSGVPVGGYIYMANRGSGWRQVTSTGVRSHFAELYSSQFQIDDQFTIWKNAGEPGAPMVNFGEAATTASQIAASTKRACTEVPNHDWLGVYVYPQPLEGARLAAMVNALNACTRP
jgi:hypothetical protein